MRAFFASVGILSVSLSALGQTVSSIAPSRDLPFDSTQVLDADVILRPELTRGANFSVRREVPVRDGINYYTIDSPFGVFTAEGNSALIQRLVEIQAIAKLTEVSRSEQYRDALKGAAKAPLELAESLIEHPGDTASGIGKGLWKKINGIGQSLKEIGQGRPQSIYEDSVPEDLIGFSETKRQIAFKLGVDPYSSNKTLQKELKKVAWAAYGGQMTLAGALMPIGGAAGLAIQGVQVSGKSLAALRELNPTDLRLRNLQLLLAMGVDRDLANRFLNNANLSPTHQTLIVDSLQELGGISGTATFVRLAARADDETDAIRYSRSAQLLAGLHASESIDFLSDAHGLPVALTTDKKLIAPLEWDYATWDRDSERFVNTLKSGEIDRRQFDRICIYITGDASPTARLASSQNQITLTERALPGPLK